MSPNAVVCIPDARLRSLFSLLLTDAGALVAACPDLDEVQRVLGTRFCKLCVICQSGQTDLGEFVAGVRRSHPDTKILLIANREDVDAVMPLFSLGLSDALLQPINPKRAVSALQKLVGKEKGAAASAPGGSMSPIAGDADYRPVHLIARSAAMRRSINELWSARNDPIGVILRGEAGVEFELAAREYQSMGGDAQGYLVVLGHQELDVETLATQLSLDRLNEGVPRTYFVPEIEKVPREQQKPLLEFLRRARRQRDKEKLLRIVFASTESDAADGEFLEELQFIVPAVVRLPALRERREDVEPLLRRAMLDITGLFPDYRARSIHPAALQWLCARPWRGNHRELLGVMCQAVMDCGNRELGTAHFGRLTDGDSGAEEAAAARVLAAVARAGRL